MWEDPVVTEVRRAREQLCQRFDFDVSAIFADIMKRQAALGSRLIRQPKAEKLVAEALESAANRQ
jgi:hypothetical protein